MNKYCISRVWQFHGKLNKQFYPSPNHISNSGKKLLDFGGNCNLPSNIVEHLNFEAHSKFYPKSHIEFSSDDIFPAIDILPSVESLSLINNGIRKYLQNEKNEKADAIPASPLISFLLFRITDYGYLNLYVIFEDEQIDYSIENNFEITRWFSEFTPNLDLLFKQLEENDLISFATHTFGIPNTFVDIINMDETHTFIYQVHLFIDSKNKKDLEKYSKEFYGIPFSQSNKIDLIGEDFKIVGIKTSPIWIFDSIPENYEVPYYTEPDNRVLTELNTINNAGHLYTEVSRLLSVKDKIVIKKLRKNKDISGMLRRISVNYSWILQTIRIRYKELDEWQRNYENFLKADDLNIAESKSIYKDSENMLSKIIETLDVDADRKYQKRIESFFLIFAGITLGSTYVDIITFIEDKPSNFQNVQVHFLEIKILFFIILTVLIVIFMASRRK
ncbi:MAG: hypothetical protein JNM22_12100 [Saprospiraceae bacterium]|nr:hypothetical protein [Saprospiraceae bacterium]